MSTREYMLGNVAIARGIVEGGGRVISGYPGTPSSEIVDTLSKMKERDFYVEWSVNEKVAMEVAAGAAMTGVRSVVTMKHVGLNVAADPLMTLSYMGVKGGMVVIVADDPGCHSSQNEQDTRIYSEFSLMPCLDPSTPQEAKDMIPYAFELSEKFELPVIFRPTTRISHGKADIELGEITEHRVQAKFEKDTSRWVMVPSNAVVRHPHLLSIQDGIREELETSPWNELTLNENSKIGVIAAGIASVYAKEAIENLGVSASYLKIGAYPVPEGLIKKMYEQVDTVLVIEELEPIVEDRCKIIAKDMESNVKIIGKTDGTVPRVGELNVDHCVKAIADVFGIESGLPEIKEIEMELPPRPPAMCAGCSHRATYYAMKKVFGKNAVFPSDIGCYTLGIQNGTVDTTLCMGGSITVASGIYHSGEKQPICCSIGDSTFFHTGMNGLLNAVYNKANITVAILDNRITAMTGHQPNPGMGLTSTGEATKEIDLEQLCRGLGAEFVEVVDSFDVKATIEAFKCAKDYEGTSVIISKQPCIIYARRTGVRLIPFKVDHDKCVGCRMCVNLGCPAIEFDKETKKSTINAMCTGCGLCAEVCKFDAIKEVQK
ncbi:indolepyruvate ferredoxin oxidoreductase subunit alpha [Methanococcoides seepicolus]|uniref:Indolepyruvate oxidoreductase subunit IorA n=1 Tax=Methanococcoides seepicolus TaxID=2828780 RepID=A0A9E5DB01_9EURY|nr:indolepyruvate ferredoxin oxidoreductase subunit alpha [Methanococcoides seepicolus]MCM1985539.1 indolepyruvate ferredoxin oxidoreductase subunit alpha [Methanococcoides seepicolus]